MSKSKMKIRFEFLIDSCDCDTCGVNYAEGGRIYFDDELKFEFLPHAYCYDSDHMGEFELIEKAFDLLGHEVSFD